MRFEEHRWQYRALRGCVEYESMVEGLDICIRSVAHIIVIECLYERDKIGISTKRGTGRSGVRVLGYNSIKYASTERAMLSSEA